MKIIIDNVFTCSEIFNVTMHPVYKKQVYKYCKTPWTFFIQCGNFKTFPEVSNFSVCGFDTKKLAEKQRQLFLDTQPYRKYIAVVLKNNDSIEGRGPMIFSKLFVSPNDAHEYVIRQGGICSNEPQGEPGISFGVNINSDLYGSIRYDGYEILLEPLN